MIASSGGRYERTRNKGNYLSENIKKNVRSVSSRCIKTNSFQQ